MTTTLRNADVLFNDSSVQTTAAPTGSWNNLTSSRALDTTYTNSNSKPIFWSLSGVLVPSSAIDMQVSGVAIAQFGTASVNARAQLFGVVPKGATYRALTSGGSAMAVGQWFEYY